jgi:hypothetical protein
MPLGRNLCSKMRFVRSMLASERNFKLAETRKNFEIK